MGYDSNRFEGVVDEELICPICSGVLEDPVQAPQCEHAFCECCIQVWLQRQPTCPVDRQPITVSQLKPVPRILRNLLSRLEIRCDNHTHGCSAVVKLDSLAAHVHDCEFNPKRPVQCESGCGLTVPKDEIASHNCVRELRTTVGKQQNQIDQLQAVVNDQKQSLQSLKHEIHVMKDYLRGLRVPSPRIVPSLSDPAVEDTIETEQFRRWIQGMPPARVTRWGGLISTPDAVLQAVIKRALLDSGCPPTLVNELMENAHERRWPPGLSTLETRQLNRRHYEGYHPKRIPGKQAVVVLTCENTNMPDDMLVEPGLVMIFAHGIE